VMLHHHPHPLQVVSHVRELAAYTSALCLSRDVNLPAPTPPSPADCASCEGASVQVVPSPGETALVGAFGGITAIGAGESDRAGHHVS
jgi:hypothetical protein